MSMFSFPTVKIKASRDVKDKNGKMLLYKGRLYHCNMHNKDNFSILFYCENGKWIDDQYFTDMGIYPFYFSSFMVSVKLENSKTFTTSGYLTEDKKYYFVYDHSKNLFTTVPRNKVKVI